MHPSKRKLGEALKPLLKAHGYRKRAMTWHRANEATIQVFHAEKSRWGFDDYSFHFAIYLRARGPELTPPYYRCPIQIQLYDLGPDRMKVLDLCDFEKGSLDPATRIAEIVRLVADYGIPWLNSHSSIAALKEMVNCEYHKLVPRTLVWLAEYDYLRALKVE